MTRCETRPVTSRTGSLNTDDDISISTTPVALIVSVTPYRHTRAVTIICPFCSREHEHGWPYPDDFDDVDTAPGSRAPHCGYKLRHLAGPAYYIPLPGYACGVDDIERFGKAFKQRTLVAS